jgi:hypothetical protein
VATISSTGLATGVSSGTTTISATSALLPKGQLSGGTSLTVNTVGLSSLVLNGTPNKPTIVQTDSGPTLQLTNGGGSETVSAWSPAAITVSSAFTTTFQFQISPASSGPNSIADGFAFVIQGASTGTATMGTTTAGMYIGYAGIPNSLAVEFDTYQNGQYDDPASPHIAIQSLGSSKNTPDHTPTTGATLGGGPVLATFADGKSHTATITYDGNVTLQVQLDSTAIVTATLPYPISTFLGLTGSTAYVGFTAATGAGSETSVITSWNWASGYTGTQQPTGVLAIDNFFVPPYSIGTLAGQNASGYGFTGAWTTVPSSGDLTVLSSGNVGLSSTSGSNSGDSATFASPITLSGGQLFISYNVSDLQGTALAGTALDLNIDSASGDQAILGASGGIFSLVAGIGLGSASAQTSSASTGTHHLVGVLDATNSQIAIFVDPTAASYYTANGASNASATASWTPTGSLSFPSYTLVENTGDLASFGNVVFATAPNAVGLSATAP